MKHLLWLLFFVGLSCYGQIQNGTARRVIRGSGEPSSGMCTAGTVSDIYVVMDAESTDSPLRICANTGSGTYAWVSSGSNSGTGVSCPPGTAAGVICANGYISRSTDPSEIGMITGTEPTEAVLSADIVAGFYPVTLWSRADGATCAKLWSTSTVGVNYCNGPVDRIAVGAFSGGGSAISGSQTACSYIAKATTISGVTILGNPSGSVTVDITAQTYASYGTSGPAGGASITASAIPALTSDFAYRDTTLTGWTTAVVAGTVLCFELTSPTTVETINVVLEGK